MRPIDVQVIPRHYVKISVKDRLGLWRIFLNLRVEEMRPARAATNLPDIFPPRTSVNRVALHALVNRWSESRDAEPRRADLGGGSRDLGARPTTERHR